MINIYNIFVRMNVCGPILVLILLLNSPVKSQAPATYSSSEVLHHIQKLKVLGSALYMAAHPDDENTRLIAWLSNDQLLKTGYLSITRGDGGQNLIGEEQGVALGLIRTQELLAARRLDGGEQFFTRAYDFGFSKSTEEALRVWGKEKVLGDVVWVIRKFRPDVIVTRFPPDNRAGHGHHSASSVLAREAFKLAADSNAYPEQFRHGVTPWQAKRILWNSYVFGSINTTSEDQMKIDVGGFNTLAGKSYGEIAAESRSQHKSQGFGVAASRGKQLEYFSPLGGSAPVKSLTEGINLTWSRINAPNITGMINRIISSYSVTHPGKSVASLVALYKAVEKLPASYWKNVKLEEISEVIAAASGLWMEAYSDKPFATLGDSLAIDVVLNNRNGVAIRWNSYSVNGKEVKVDSVAGSNINMVLRNSGVVPEDMPVTQPYWLREKMGKGFFIVKEQELVGLPESPPAFEVAFNLIISGDTFTYRRPVQYKFADPVRGEVYRPLNVIPATPANSSYGKFRHISYNHIPDIFYYDRDTVVIRLNDVKIAGKNIGYIEGAGDKVPAALSLMGYQVTVLKEKDITLPVLQQFDAVITGVRAYNVHPFLAEKNSVLNEYVKNGGNLVVQYNTNSFVGPINASIGPYKFDITRERITDETSPVRFLLPEHQVLNYPNKITEKDFNDWVQERGIYFAGNPDPAFVSPIAMNDPGEKELNGSLIIARSGKGTFVYTGLVFFRQLPAGVEGAYRLLANIIALNKKPE